MRTRVGERLSHKNRCTTPHDYERVVLEAFPEVFRCKCFAGLSTGPQRAQPGSVLLVVIPAVDETGPLAGARTPRVDADQLQRIAQHVRQRASPFVQLEVCNAVYERIQVRCAVRLAPGRAAGPALARLNEAAIECLSPWSDNGRGVHFGWSLRPVDLATRLHGLEGVASLSRLSLLQVTPEGERLYHLSDSVEADQVLRARLPWSLAVPMAQHLIELDDTPQDVAPRASGIDMLELGNTFVVDGPAPTASPGRRHG